MLSGKKLILLGAIVVLLAAIPLTLYFVSQQNEVRSRATPATTLSFNPTSDTTNPIRKNIDDTFKLDVSMDPGTNAVTFVKLHLIYDATKIEIVSPKIETITGVSSAIKAATYTANNATISLGIVIDPSLVDPTKTIRTPTKIASVTFKAIAPTTQATSITFGNQVVVYANNETGDPNAAYPKNLNVLSSTRPAFIAIGESTTITPTPTPILTTPTPTSPATSPTPTPTGTSSSSNNQIPICNTLNVDRAKTGVAPFPITFTANGTDTDGTINRVTFNFGDGPVSDLTQSGGIGTKTVSAQISHTYNNAGNFTATATLTDNNGGVSSASAACSQAIVVTAASGSAAVTPTLAELQSLETTETISTPTPIPVVIASPGPQNQIISLGAIGAALSIIGAIIFFAL